MASNERLIVVSPLQPAQKQEIDLAITLLANSVSVSGKLRSVLT